MGSLDLCYKGGGSLSALRARNNNVVGRKQKGEGKRVGRRSA